MGSYVELDFFPEAPPAIVGNLTTEQIVNIEVWQSGVIIPITASGCLEVGSTGRYSWSTGNIPTLSAGREQFHWRMSDGYSNTDEGDFILISHENKDGGMPSLNNQDSYIIQN